MPWTFPVGRAGMVCGWLYHNWVVQVHICHLFHASSLQQDESSYLPCGCGHPWRTAVILLLGLDVLLHARL